LHAKGKLHWCYAHRFNWCDSSHDRQQSPLSITNKSPWAIDNNRAFVNRNATELWLVPCAFLDRYMYLVGAAVRPCPSTVFPFDRDKTVNFNTWIMRCLSTSISTARMARANRPKCSTFAGKYSCFTKPLIQRCCSFRSVAWAKRRACQIDMEISSTFAAKVFNLHIISNRSQ
jgi:hypothetical protein